MTIQTFALSQKATVDAIPDPKTVWMDAHQIVVYTGLDIPGALKTANIVSPRQIRQALTKVGMRDAVEAAIKTSDQDIKDWWEFGTQIERNHPVVVSWCNAFGLTAAQVDDVFALAASL